MKTYRGVKIPKNNGRPQLWTRAINDHQSLRIIYPSGKVEYIHHFDALLDKRFFKDTKFWDGCTSRETFYKAIRAVIRFEKRQNDLAKPLFLGYL